MAACAGALQAQVMVNHIQTDKSPTAVGVWAGDTYYLSGQLASPINPADPAKGTPADYGDTKAQAASVFAKIQKALQDQGLDMKDVVKMAVFLGPDPKTGKLDFMGMQSEYVKYFGTKDQPNKPARSAFQVAALAAPWALLEIEVIAVKSK
jgi:enamine deaminase RidA (YjgF/YER057c/UK114 family)